MFGRALIILSLRLDAALRALDLRLAFEKADRSRITVTVGGCFTITTPALWPTDAPVKADTAVFNNEGTRAAYVLDIPLEGPQNTIVTFYCSGGQAKLRISAIPHQSLSFEAYQALQRADLNQFEAYFLEGNCDVAAAIAFTKAMINGIPALVSNAASIDGRTHVEIAVRLPSPPGASLQPQIEDLAKRSWTAKPSPAKRSTRSWPQAFRLKCRRPVPSLGALRLPSHIQCHNDDPQEGSFLALQGTPGALKRLRGMIQGSTVHYNLHDSIRHNRADHNLKFKQSIRSRSL